MYTAIGDCLRGISQKYKITYYYYDRQFGRMQIELVVDMDYDSI